jgi:hypothetical protein
MFIMVTIINLFNYLMKLSLYDNHGELQPQVTTYQGEVHLHQLKQLLVFKTLEEKHVFSTNLCD